MEAAAFSEMLKQAYYLRRYNNPKVIFFINSCRESTKTHVKAIVLEKVTLVWDYPIVEYNCLLRLNTAFTWVL
jgi:hypothetical protein